jgi:hypothetical protein
MIRVPVFSGVPAQLRMLYRGRGRDRGSSGATGTSSGGMSVRPRTTKADPKPPEVWAFAILVLIGLDIWILIRALIRIF